MDCYLTVNVIYLFKKVKMMDHIHFFSYFCNGKDATQKDFDKTALLLFFCLLSHDQYIYVSFHLPDSLQS